MPGRVLKKLGEILGKLSGKKARGTPVVPQQHRPLRGQTPGVQQRRRDEHAGGAGAHGGRKPEHIRPGHDTRTGGDRRGERRPEHPQSERNARAGRGRFEERKPQHRHPEQGGHPGRERHEERKPEHRRPEQGGQPGREGHEERKPGHRHPEREAQPDRERHEERTQPQGQRPAREEGAGGGDRGDRRRRGRRGERTPRGTQGAVTPPEAQLPDTTPVPAAPPWDPSVFVVAPEEGKVRFHDLDLPPELMHAIYDLGFQYCTPIQAGILRETLAGKDATGRAQTGTGKTAAFLITILTHFTRTPPPADRKHGSPRALVLAPTRELVLQIDKDAKALSPYTPFTSMAVFGGMDYRKQQQQLKAKPIDIVAATPGRLLDFKRKEILTLRDVEILVIDEADRMLDMGFIPDVRRIIESTPMKGKRQTLFFSATLTPEVHRLAAAWTRDAVQIDVTPPQEVTLSTIDQMVYIITDEDKFLLLYNLITKRNLERVMVFANRRDETQFLRDRLAARNIRCGLLSGDVSQDQRVRTLEAFRNGRFKVLVATDVAARGLHIEGVSHVVNYSLPMDPQDYVHRIGRTGRAGASGISVSFATETEAYEIPAIEEFIGRKLTATHPDPDLLTALPPLAEGVSEPRKRSSRRPRQGNRGRGGGGRRRGPSRPGSSSAGA